MGSATERNSSIKSWCRDHRAHHRYVDTDADPYSVHKGLFHAHLGWIILRQDRSSLGQADMDDLSADPIVEGQRQHCAVLAVTMAVILPTTVAGLGWWSYLCWFPKNVFCPAFRLLRQFCCTQLWTSAIPKSKFTTR